MNTDDTYTPVPRDRDAERQRCEATIPGYHQARAHSPWVQRLREELALGQALEECLPERSVEPPPSL